MHIFMNVPIAHTYFHAAAIGDLHHTGAEYLNSLSYPQFWQGGEEYEKTDTFNYNLGVLPVDLP